MNRSILHSISLAAALAAVGCSQEKPAASSLPPGHPATPGMGAMGGRPMNAAAATGGMKGTVQEKIDAAGYSYLKLATGSGEMWAAVPLAPVAIGQEVTISNPMPMNGFESKTLNRKFEQLVFGTLDGQGSAAGGAMGAMGGGAMGGGAMGAMGGGAMQPVGSAPGVGAMPSGHPTLPAEEIGVVKVEKATGPDARTVAEVFAQKAALGEKQVVVRGKVVKFTGGVMNKNWIHVRDGSGGEGDNDLTVTTQDTVAVGDVVTIKGTVHLDKDFGAGYAYGVIVEEATATK